MEKVKQDYIEAVKSVTEDNALLAKATFSIREMLRRESQGQD